MKKHIMLGVNTKENTCCIIECLLPFNQLKPDEIEDSDFNYSATNWCGRDDIQRTLSLENLTCTGNILKLPAPITVRGADSDMGHTCPWQFSFTEIHETKSAVALTKLVNK